ncbi:hypothetical protein R1sor_001686 [Riccia sorocarpa]|uniref:Cytochrome b5 heme-binding domain-containing protein n=1 Tax=Riccia sorocarpa TaxID=122646 RepID=A0ABD3H0M9_9MARC
MPPHAPDSTGHGPDTVRPPYEGISAQDTRSPLKKYTLKDVSKHNTPEDCWLVIWGKVYNVTSWVKVHPGGSLIYVKAGQDSTQLFDSYHPLYVRKMLSEYCIGEIQSAPEDDKFKSSTLQFGDGEHEAFYCTVKQRVETFFRQRKINPRYHPQMLLKSLAILGTLFLCYYLGFFLSKNILLSAALVSIMGFCMAEVGMSIMHDGNHGSYTKSTFLGYVMSATLDLVGSSSFMWRQQHVAGHHSFTNIDHYDPDIRKIGKHRTIPRVKDPDLRRVTSEQPQRWFHQYQHIYLGILYGVLALKSVFIDDFSAYFGGTIGPVKVARMTPLELAIFWGGKVVYALYMFVLPLMYGQYNTLTFIGLYILSQLVAGWTLALFFQVAHVVDDAVFPTVQTDGVKSKIPSGWAEMQVRTTTNFSSGSLFWTHISGGLNHQIEHHLFPGICHVHYPSIQSIVKTTCDEFKVPYTSYPTFWAALRAHFQYLKRVGLQDGLRLDG